MSQIRLCLDEDAIKGALVRALRNSDVDVLAVSDANRHSFSDEEQLLWAAEQGRVIYSFNMGDFCRLHRDLINHEKDHAGIILAPQQRYSVGDQLRGLEKGAEGGERLIKIQSINQTQHNLTGANFGCPDADGT